MILLQRWFLAFCKNQTRWGKSETVCSFLRLRRASERRRHGNEKLESRLVHQSTRRTRGMRGEQMWRKEDQGAAISYKKAQDPSDTTRCSSFKTKDRKKRWQQPKACSLNRQPYLPTTAVDSTAKCSSRRQRSRVSMRSSMRGMQTEHAQGENATTVLTNSISWPEQWRSKFKATCPHCTQLFHLSSFISVSP